MTRITRKTGFFKNNQFLIFAIFWFLLAIAMFITSSLEENAPWFRRFLLPCLYLIPSILYFISALQIKGKNSEYIEWNEERLIVKKQGEKPIEYKLSDLKNLTVANNDLIIKAPKATGTMMSLKGYSEEELQKLQLEFSDFNRLKLL
ncbi:hypothetical protein RM553_11840 [Zunongwangia sp. F363]|uniref:Uncharacterized protein n=1 Tax=Autumnicola tepida TaxID=3075595 RepID=A0ABU3CBW2_9FLAO|nr:hypothetical protein [Zunongwangia sp. F363]MDT0643525.1 hypothetical protein [Zunongwangia sp. F363]